MKKEDCEDAIYMVGPEVQHTPVFSSKTLFVVGVRSISQIVEYAQDYDAKAVYLGANASFQRNKLWNKIITELINKGMKVSLEYPVDAHDFVSELLAGFVWGNANFIPIVNCKINNVEQTNSNLTFLLDCDNRSNQGTWCMPAHELLDSNRYVPWSEYEHTHVVLRDEKKNEKSQKVKKVAQTKTVAKGQEATVVVEETEQKTASKSRPRKKARKIKSETID